MPARLLLYFGRDSGTSAGPLPSCKPQELACHLLQVSPERQRRYCRQQGRWTPAVPPPLRRPRDASLSAARAAAVGLLELVVLVLPQVVLMLGVEA